MRQSDLPVAGSKSKRKLDVGFADERGVMKIVDTNSCCKRVGEQPRRGQTHKGVAGFGKIGTGDFHRPTHSPFHGFTLCGSIMHLWKFDRLGGWNSLLHCFAGTIDELKAAGEE